jgi:hypothetical protein
VAPIRALVPVVATAALVLPAVAACSGTSSGGVTSTSVTPSVSASASASVSATGTPATPSVDTSRLAAIATCLKKAGLPTPTSTDAAGTAVELLRLARDPATANALRKCGIPLPGGSASSSTTSG